MGVLAWLSPVTIAHGGRVKMQMVQQEVMPQPAVAKKRTAQQEAMQQPASASKGGNMSRGSGATRGHATTNQGKLEANER